MMSVLPYGATTSSPTTAAIMANNRRRSSVAGGAVQLLYQPSTPLENILNCRVLASQTSTDAAKSTASKGFYRQPLTTTPRPRPPANLTQFRRKQFAHRQLWNSDLSEVPPSEGLESPSSSRLFQRRHSSAEVYRGFQGKPSASFPPSILKRDEDTHFMLQRHRRMPSSPMSTRKSTKFSENVDVIYYDQRERPTSCTTRESEKLKDSKQASPTTTERSIRLRCPLHCRMDSVENSLDTDREGNLIRKCIFNDKRLELFPEEDEDDEGEGGPAKVKLFIPIGFDYIRNRTSVKALSGGRRLIIMAYRMEQPKEEGGEPYLHQYVERLTLPHTIDAYAVKASMDKEGNLKINARTQDTRPESCHGNPSPKTLNHIIEEEASASEQT